jgi:hypothetical protein
VEGDVQSFHCVVYYEYQETQGNRYLLTLSMIAEETLKLYSSQYWEVYNDIDVRDEDMAIKTFRFDLHQGSRLT